MLYRKSSLRPTKLLLRVVAAAGTGAVVVACGSVSSPEGVAPCEGFCGLARYDAGDDASDGSDGASKDARANDAGGGDDGGEDVVVGIVPSMDGGGDSGDDGGSHA